VVEVWGGQYQCAASWWWHAGSRKEEARLESEIDERPASAYVEEVDTPSQHREESGERAGVENRAAIVANIGRRGFAGKSMSGGLQYGVGRMNVEYTPMVGLEENVRAHAAGAVRNLQRSVASSKTQI
jgi:hypothetical protein